VIDLKTILDGRVAQALNGRGLVVADCWGCIEINKVLEKTADQFDVQDLTVHTTWPLYRRLFQLGPQERFIGRIWWPKGPAPHGVPPIDVRPWIQ
jgi:hypothetical protein